MFGSSLVILVLLAVLVVCGFVRSRPADYRITFRDSVFVGLTVFAIGMSALGVSVIFSFKFAPEVTQFDRAVRGLSVAAIGLGPLTLFLFLTWVLRGVRYLENAYRARKPS